MDLARPEIKFWVCKPFIFSLKNNNFVDVLGDWNGQQCLVELQCSTTGLNQKQSKLFKLGEQKQFSFIPLSLFERSAVAENK